MTQLIKDGKPATRAEWDEMAAKSRNGPEGFKRLMAVLGIEPPPEDEPEKP